MIENFQEQPSPPFQKMVIFHLSVEGVGGGGRLYCIEFSKTISFVHDMLNQGLEGHRPDYLQAVKAAGLSFRLM